MCVYLRYAVILLLNGVHLQGVLLLYSSITILSGGVTGAMFKEKST